MTPTATFSRHLRFGLQLLALLLTTTAAAQSDDEPRTPEQQQAAEDWEAAMSAMVRGPQAVALLEKGQLALPDGFGFVPKREATTLRAARCRVGGRAGSVAGATTSHDSSSAALRGMGFHATLRRMVITHL